MIVLRVLGLAALIAIAVLIGLYAFSQDRRYLRAAWRVFVGALTLVLAVAAVVFFERLAAML